MLDQKPIVCLNLDELVSCVISPADAHGRLTILIRASYVPLPHVHRPVCVCVYVYTAFNKPDITT